jgi:DNA polymerase-3 subunit epsilon
LKDYYLFIDTETSGLPKNWKAPYALKNNWPHIIQIAWIIYDENFIEIKRQNRYIKNTAIKIEKSARKIHHITEAFLNENGQLISTALKAFYQDIKKYKPTLIGHFLEFDYHMINVEFERIGKKNILKNLPLFCTMKASKSYVRNPSVELLKLNDFYFELFNDRPEESHNALSDALNTAKIFIHLFKSGEINKQTILAQNNNFSVAPLIPKISKTKKILNRLFST